jgi:hypothetical protein
MFFSSSIWFLHMYIRHFLLSTNNFTHAQTLSRISSLSGHMNIARVNIEFFTGCKKIKQRRISFVLGYLRMILWKISTAISLKHRILAIFNIKKFNSDSLYAFKVLAFLFHDLNNSTLVCFVLHWLYLDYHFVCAYFLVTCMLVNIVVWLIDSVFNFLSHGVIFFYVNQISTHGWKVYSHFLQ